MTTSRRFLILGLVVLAVENPVQAFQQRSCLTAASRVSSITSSKTTRRYGFFKDAFGKAFENDRTLSTDKSEGQYDNMMIGEEYVEPDELPSSQQLTETQRKWREATLQTPESKKNIIETLLEDTTWKLDLYLSGVPERDPSNDLYGSKVNISSRDKSTGLTLPNQASTTISVKFVPGGVCQVDESDFTSGDVAGEWKLSDDYKTLRFSIDQLGYTKTVETRGSIQKIYWSDEDEKTVETSTTYNIAPGFVYCDIDISQGRQPGTLVLGQPVPGSVDGVIRVEQSSGLFGISSKMVTCGKFEAKQSQ